MSAAAATGERHLNAQYVEERQWAETNLRELNTWREAICIPVTFYNIISPDTSDCQLPGEQRTVPAFLLEQYVWSLIEVGYPMLENPTQ